jgi:hypothetical protein
MPKVAGADTRGWPVKDSQPGTPPQQQQLASTYARSTSLGWLRIVITRATQLLWIKIITQPEVLSKDLYGFVSFVALGASLVAGLGVPWIGWVMTQRGLAEKDPEKSTRFIHQMAVYGIASSLVLVPILAFVFIYVTYLSASGQALPFEGMIMIVAIAVAASLFQLFQSVYSAFLKMERYVLIGTVRAVAYNLFPLVLYLVTGNVLLIFWGWVIADLVVISTAIPTCGLKRDASLYRPKLPDKALVIFTLPVLLLTVFDTFRGVISGVFTFIFFGSANFATYNLVIGVTTIATDAILTLMLPFGPIMVVVLKSRPERVGIALGTVLKMVSHAIFYVSPILIFCGTPAMAAITSSQYLGPETQATLSYATLMMAATVLNALFLNLIGSKGLTYRLLLFEAFYALVAIPFYYLFAFLGWLQTLGIAGVAVCTGLGFTVTLVLLALQTKELKQVGWKVLTRIAALGIPQAGVTFLLSLWLAPIDLIDLGVILLVTLGSVFLFSGLLSCFTGPELEVVSRASKGKLNGLIRFYERLGPHGPSEDVHENH